MAAILIISFYDDTSEEIELSKENGKYWQPTMQGLMIKTNGVQGSRTVYPWTSIRKYHVETEAGQRDRERIAEERLAREVRRKFRRHPEVIRYFQRDCSPLGGCGHVHEQADQGPGGSEGDAPVGPE